MKLINVDFINGEYSEDGVVEAIPISFIKARIKRLDSDIDFELYESDGMDWRPIIKKESLLELIREWEKYEASKNSH